MFTVRVMKLGLVVLEGLLLLYLASIAAEYYAVNLLNHMFEEPLQLRVTLPEFIQ